MQPFFASTKCRFFASTKVQHANAREHGREGTQLKQLALVNRAEQTKLMDQNGDVVIVMIIKSDKTKVPKHDSARTWVLHMGANLSN